MEKRNRLHLIDALRGFALVNMVLFHLVYDLRYVYGFGLGWYSESAGYIWQQAICWSFIFISGFSWSLGGKPLKRGLIVFGGGLLISLVTLIFMPSELIICGVLTLLSSSMLLMIPLDRFCRRLNPYAGAAFSFFLFAFTKPVSSGYLGLFDIQLIRLPEFLYLSDIPALFGFHSASFFSSDYFPLLGWFFLFLTGYFVFKCISRHDRALQFLELKPPLLPFIGRHSFLIYLLHQPLLIVLIELFRILFPQIS